MAPTSVGVSPAMISSNSTSFGRIASARATSSRFSRPTVSELTGVPRIIGEPDIGERRFRQLARAGDRLLAQERAQHDVLDDRQLPVGLRDLERAGDADARHVVRLPAGHGLPSKTISPDVGGSTPAIRLNSVLLPAPFGPIRPSNSPWLHLEGLTSSTAQRGAEACG